ncbi:MAG: ROK family protein [Christensenellaceae bacterium]
MKTPVLDKNFYPMIKALEEYDAKVKKCGIKTEVVLVAERNGGYNYVYRYTAFADGCGEDELNFRIAERLAKTILWVVGGYKISVAGSKKIYEGLKEAYTSSGARAFDVDFMSGVYERPFEVTWLEENEIPAQKNCSMRVGGYLKGCRIGFDAGGSDRKVSAVIDGEVVYSEEVVWHPKTTEDPHYHYNEILTAMKTAASKMPRVDCIGVSSAGVYVDNKIMVASLFIKVDKQKHGDFVKNMYIDIAKEMGNVPLEVANDGDVTALAGSIDLGDNKVLGIAMGTSEAVGYINADGGINGWLSELAFVPVDFNENAMADEWSGDTGVGCKYFSQDAVIKLAEAGGYKFKAGATPAEKLKEIQALMERTIPSRGRFTRTSAFISLIPFLLRKVLRHEARASFRARDGRKGRKYSARHLQKGACGGVSPICGAGHFPARRKEQKGGAEYRGRVSSRRSGIKTAGERIQ